VIDFQPKLDFLDLQSGVLKQRFQPALGIMDVICLQGWIALLGSGCTVGISAGRLDGFFSSLEGRGSDRRGNLHEFLF
jgi:hypothetical protein